MLFSPVCTIFQRKKISRIKENEHSFFPVITEAGKYYFKVKKFLNLSRTFCHFQGVSGPLFGEKKNSRTFQNFSKTVGTL